MQRLIKNNGEYSHLVSWSSSGDSFRIHDNYLFSQVVLPRYFRHDKWSSFVRQLNSEYAKSRLLQGMLLIHMCFSVYDFHKLPDCDPSVDTSSNDVSSDAQSTIKSSVCDFKHQFFHRDRFDELYKIKRKPTRDQRRYYFHYVNIDHMPDTPLNVSPLPRQRQLAMDSSALGRLDQRVEQLLSSMQQTTNDLRDMRASLLHRSRASTISMATRILHLGCVTNTHLWMMLDPL